MVGKTALNKEMKHLNGAYFRTIINSNAKYETRKYTISVSFYSFGFVE